MSYKIIDNPHNEQTNDVQFSFIYDISKKEIISYITQAAGYTSSPHRMVIGDTKEELMDYINDNKLIADFDY